MLIQEFSLMCGSVLQDIAQIQKSDDPREMRAKSLNICDDLGDIASLHSSIAEDAGDEEFALMSKLMSALIQTSGFIDRQEIDEVEEMAEAEVMADTYLRYAEFFGKLIKGERPVSV